MKAAADTRGTLVYDAVYNVESTAYSEALDCVDGIEGMDSDVSDDEEEYKGDVQNTENDDADEATDMVDSASLMNISTSVRESGLELSTVEPKRKASKDIFKPRKHGTEEGIVMRNDSVQI
jgi:hypothetical protein